MEDSRADRTQFRFGSQEVMEQRRRSLSELRGVKHRTYFMDQGHELCRSLFDLMILEGRGAGFVDELIGAETDDEYALTLDVLHCAALILGEEYVRQQLIGKTMDYGEVIQQIKNDLLEEKFRPYQEIYDNLDERIDAALHGERQVGEEIMKLKMQLNSSRQLYENRLATERMRHEYEEGKLKSESKHQHQSDQEKIGRLEEEVKKLQAELEERKAQAQQSAEAQASLQEEARTAKAETERLTSELEKTKEELSASQADCAEQKAQVQLLTRSLEEAKDEAKTAKAKAEAVLAAGLAGRLAVGGAGAAAGGVTVAAGRNGNVAAGMTGVTGQNGNVVSGNAARTGEGKKPKKKGFLRSLWATPDDEESKAAEDAAKAEVAAMAGKEEELKQYLEMLSSDKYSQEQIALITDCMMDDTFPRSTLTYICNPNLPLANMEAMVRLTNKRRRAPNDAKHHLSHGPDELPTTPQAEGATP